MSAPRAASIAMLVLVSFSGSGPASSFDDLGTLQGTVVGEVTDTSALLQSRLTTAQRDPRGDVVGRAGVARFEVARTPDFANPISLPSERAVAARDFIVRSRAVGLTPATRYYYRLAYGSDEATPQRGPIGRFRTLPGSDRDAGVRFVVLSCMNYSAFHDGKGSLWWRQGPYTGEDRAEGYPALVAIRAFEPDFVILNGDNVYYDKGVDPATDRAAMRARWHEQFAQPRFVALFAETATYWTKDDHDFRFNDADLSGDAPPSPALGVEVFREQAPIVEMGSEAPTWRTHRVSRALQLWLLEGRDHRSPNAMPDGPEKTLLGREQIAWLKRTLTESTAAFKIIVTPTPLVGPDDLWKRDNHTNPLGFRHEGEALLAWARDAVEGLYLVTGDRHWQYHSIHPTGVEELSSGALHDENARVGRAPGDWLSTDWRAEVEQPYAAPYPYGGFLAIEVEPGKGAAPARLSFELRDDEGTTRYRIDRIAADER